MNRYLPDANILIYAFQSHGPRHRECRAWLSETLGSGTGILIPEIVEVALLRITTAPALKQLAAPAEAVLAFRDALFSAPNVSRISAGPHHDRIFSELLVAHKVAGNLVNDAWLAALAIENHATLASADSDFKKFKGLKWLNPCR